MQKKINCALQGHYFILYIPVRNVFIVLKAFFLCFRFCSNVTKITKKTLVKRRVYKVFPDRLVYLCSIFRENLSDRNFALDVVLPAENSSAM